MSSNGNRRARRVRVIESVAYSSLLVRVPLDAVASELIQHSDQEEGLRSASMAGQVRQGLPASGLGQHAQKSEGEESSAL